LAPMLSTSSLCGLLYVGPMGLSAKFIGSYIGCDIIFGALKDVNSGTITERDI
jgi:hypothetical protein